MTVAESVVTVADPQFVVASPDGTSQWRLRADFRLERSAALPILNQAPNSAMPNAPSTAARTGSGRGGGRGTVTQNAAQSTASSWQEVALPAGTRLTAGSVPSREVAWFVGQGGFVLIADASGVRQVSRPTTSDLVVVEASSARAARVGAADGRRFVTDDGGMTWKGE
jgi:hypothetical protein